MAESPSWLLLEAIAERVRGITVANGYMTDLGLARVVLDEDDLDRDTVGTVVDAGLITVTSATALQLNYELDITVEFGVPRGGAFDNPKELLHRAVLDLASALQIRPRELPQFVREFVQTGAQLASGEDDAGAAFVVAQVTARAGLTHTKQPATAIPVTP